MKKEDIQVPANSNADQEEPAASNTPTRRLAPVVTASALTIIWTALGLYVVLTGDILPAPLVDLAPLVSAYATPIAIFWLVALAFQRTDPLLERRLAVANNLHKATAPVDEAERRLIALNKSLKTELKNIEAVSELASERIENLENRFQEQISNLFSATADTEAKTTSIRDVLSRERDSLGSLSSDLETRFMTLEKAVGAIASELEDAGHSISASANTAKSKLEESIHDYGESAGEIEERIEKIREGLKEQTDGLQASATHIETRLHHIHDVLTNSMSDFSGEIGNIEGRSNELTHHMQTQATILKELAETSATESQKIEKTLQSHIGEVREAANDALARTSDVGEIVSERASAMSKQIITAVDEAKTMLADAGSTLEKHGTYALEPGREINDQVSNATKTASEEFQKKASELDQTLNDNFAKAQKILEETSTAISEQSQTAVTEAEAVAERTLQHIRQLRAGIEDQMRELAETGQTSKDALIEQADQLAEKAADIVSKAGNASGEFDGVRERMDGQNEAITNALNDTRMKLSRLEADLMAQQEVLQNASEASANKVIEATERFIQRAEDIQTAGDQSSQILHKKSTELGEIMEDVGQSGLIAHQKIADSIDNLSVNAGTMREEIANTSSSLANAADAFSGERDRIRSETEESVTRINQAANAMRGNIDVLAENSVSIADQLETAGQVLMDRTNQAQEHIKEASQNTQEELAATLENIGDKAGERISFLREEMQATLTKVLDEYQENTERAEKESSFLAMRLGKEATRINETVEHFLDKSKEIETRIARATKNEFARTSSLLMESLQSTSIDINKALSQDIPDSVWTSFTDGDKSIFMRRSLMFGDRKSRKMIAAKYQTDSEFREVVDRYLRDFESMIERAMIGDKGSTMSVTLLSSDMGKLYVMLGQTLKKFS
jgi:predicted  nucleic acid-binding Zn-ribbon protein